MRSEQPEGKGSIDDVRQINDVMMPSYLLHGVVVDLKFFRAEGDILYVGAELFVFLNQSTKLCILLDYLFTISNYCRCRRLNTKNKSNFCRDL